MCGIAGFFTPTGFNSTEARAIACKMRDRLVHRGPDDAGDWLDGEAGIALGHRRLSVLDLSASGHQPMLSASGRFVLAFNGEIYNHLKLRTRISALNGLSWRGHSDTESLLAAIETWGIEEALEASVGMFSLALWDRRERKLTLARDRMGEKPLYYGWQGSTLLFGSELKALRAHPEFRSEINSDVLPLYLRHGYIPSPWSVWKGISKLKPGCYVSFSATQLGMQESPTHYWSLGECIARGQSEPFSGTAEKATEVLEEQLRQAIADQRLADVPLGAFLSGGIDSSTVVALMQTLSSRPIKTFTIGFSQQGYNEAGYAQAVAKHLGTDHTELYVTSTQAQQVIGQLPNIYDEPFGDSSAIPTILVSQLARQHVTVSLSGDGGDELFAGYSRYFNRKAETIWRAGRRIPKLLHPATRQLLRSSAARWTGSMLQPVMRLMCQQRCSSVAAKSELLANLIGCESDVDFYRAMTSHWHPDAVLKDAADLRCGFDKALLSGIAEPVQRMMAQDCVTYLPDDILAKVDRAAMSVSLETRVPLLDHRVIELAWRMPFSFKVRNGQSKWPLRQILHKYVPRSLIERPKKGFGVPVDEWLRGPLRTWAETLLDPKRLEAEGYFDAKGITCRWRAHLQGRENWRDSLWLVLMWQSWLETNTDHA